MSIIRLFTAGTHNGLTFSNSEIESIAQKTADFADEQIPFVLGHPKKNLPIMGFIPKSALKTYREGDKISIGFDKSACDMSDESMDVLRGMGNNKLSPRLVDGVVKHIGLVERAAVAENNTQDFAELTGVFSACDDFFENPSKGILNAFKSLFNNNKMEEKENTTAATAATPDLTSMQAKVDQTAADVARLVDAMKQQQEQKTAQDATADFAAADYSHLTDQQRADFAAMCVQLPSDQQSKFKESIRAMANKPAAPAPGSVTADFGSKGSGSQKSAEDVLRSQFNAIK